MDTKNLNFYADNLRLNGTLHMPEHVSRKRKIPVVIGSHGLLSDGQSPKQQYLAERLNKHGIAYFRFDHRGRGQSEGKFSEVTTFTGRLNDMAAAISTVTAYPGIDDEPGLFGSSMGGAVCLGISTSFRIRTIVTLAAPVRLDAIRIPPDLMQDPLFQGVKPEQMAFDISGTLKKISNILVFHGDTDEVVSFSNAVEIYEKTASPKKLVRFTGGDHALTSPDFQKAFLEQTVEWLIAQFPNFI